MIQLQPWLTPSPLLAEEELPPPPPPPPRLALLSLPPFDELISMFSGRTLTLIGVGCVLKTGTSQSFNDRLSGIRIPLPIHINLTRSPPEQLGRSKYPRKKRGEGGREGQGRSRVSFGMKEPLSSEWEHRNRTHHQARTIIRRPSPH